MSAARWSLRWRITALSAAVALLLAAITAVIAATAATNRDEITRLTDRIGPARSNAERLLTAVVSQESGVRGYALSGQLADLAPYPNGVAEENAVGQAIERLLAGEPRLLGQLRQARALAAAWRQQIAEPAIAAVRADPAGNVRSISSAAARQRFQQVLAAVGAFQAAVTTVRDRIERDVRASANLLIALLIAAAGVVVVAGAMLAALLSRLVTRPVIQLAAEVRLVSRGQYDHEISTEGPPEVRRLARDVDAMRRQIAADLAAVREARQQVEDVNRQLEAQAEELQRSNRDLEQFAYVASHDLQEPLRKVASFCQLLQRRYAGQLDSRADQYIHFAVDGAQRMQRLINDLLAFSRIGRITSGFTDVDLNRAMVEATSQLESAREYAAGEITWDSLPVVRGEEALLVGLLVNLLGNSLKFRQPDRPPQVHLSARQVDGQWEISCTDNGIGIAPEFAEKVFVIFQRLHPKDAYPGTGIGLAIAKKIIEYHGGRIWLDPDYRDGTLVRFTLPATVETTGEQSEPPAADVPGQPGGDDTAATVDLDGADAIPGQPAPAVAGGQPAPAVAGGQPAPAVGGQSAPAVGGQSAPAVGGQSAPAVGGQSAPAVAGGQSAPAVAAAADPGGADLPSTAVRP